MVVGIQLMILAMMTFPTLAQFLFQIILIPLPIVVVKVRLLENLIFQVFQLVLPLTVLKLLLKVTLLAET
jgi:hypothetical protein